MKVNGPGLGASTRLTPAATVSTAPGTSLEAAIEGDLISHDGAPARILAALAHAMREPSR